MPNPLVNPNNLSNSWVDPDSVGVDINQLEEEEEVLLVPELDFDELRPQLACLGYYLNLTGAGLLTASYSVHQWRVISGSVLASEEKETVRDIIAVACGMLSIPCFVMGFCAFKATNSEQS